VDLMREPFPLQWPKGWHRTPREERQRSRFGFRGQVSFSQARTELLVELERIGAANVVITTDLPVRRDGLPYAASRAGDDPGVAVWCVHDSAERVFACDTWLTHAENMTAIARSLEALRGLERWGMADAMTRAFTGFAALPAGDGTEYVPPAPPPAKRPWREVLGRRFNDLTEHAQYNPWPDGLEPEALLAIAKSRHRKMIQIHHPDVGGDPAIAAELNAALAEAEQELSA
jgi:hypothetical protein